MLEELKKEDFEEVYAIMESSFPESERRTKERQRKLLDVEGYHLYGLKGNGEIIGFVAEWDGPDHRFVEHFAISAHARGGGIGTKLLQAYHTLRDKPVILEVEPPADEMQKRRIAFYERNGYHLSGCGYTQPVINENHPGIPLVLMSYPEALSEERFMLFKNWIFNTVYRSDD
ncbi:GNAT family N-acetyltransferase [Lacicoccus alkaliphilus]|uniref:Ribosomal protein S18 acetylase RimI n=1 Tax=Lacicoccus alkaliphilus DSM 16010 TaxID=1123231 RepID=A0A1M7ALY7_9BACL|nr:GNAT family N-acetyltransferase [Salinicoccus alkaliphilus]SHL43802.1 Ribosomal protein S18 acetylase RimI [Salinicoccus alkaliphilus DSM 16010]